MELRIKMGQISAIFLGCLLAVATHTIAQAELAKPRGATILTVSGSIAKSNRNGTAEFDLAMLQKLSEVEFTTKTPWFDKPVKFSGVKLRDVLALVEANGTKIEAIALGDYKSILPIEDLSEYEVVLAYKRDGQYMSVREKGPLFIVYPYDSEPELHHQKFYSRSVWQLSKIIVY